MPNAENWLNFLVAAVRITLWLPVIWSECRLTKVQKDSMNMPFKLFFKFHFRANMCFCKMALYALITVSMQNYSQQSTASLLRDQTENLHFSILAHCHEGRPCLFIFPCSHPDKAMGCVCWQMLHLLQITETWKQEMAGRPTIQYCERWNWFTVRS